ncbi:MAG TPA: hypothetical protein EYP22_07300 [Methanosarcinales archaeon]|nr:hypothetical protein [Methanosarcinales archaeon]
MPKQGTDKRIGRPRISDRVLLNGILCVLRTGGQCKAVPNERSSVWVRPVTCVSRRRPFCWNGTTKSWA